MVDAGQRGLDVLGRLAGIAGAAGLGAWSATVAQEVLAAHRAVEQQVRLWLEQGVDMLRRTARLVADQQTSAVIGALGGPAGLPGLLGPAVVGLHPAENAGAGLPTSWTSPFAPAGAPGLGSGGGLGLVISSGSPIAPRLSAEPALPLAGPSTAAAAPNDVIALLSGATAQPTGLSLSIGSGPIDISGWSGMWAAATGLGDRMVAAGAPAMPIAAGTPQRFDSFTADRDNDRISDARDANPGGYDPP